jgi:hypothetical protein
MRMLAKILLLPLLLRLASSSSSSSTTAASTSRRLQAAPLGELNRLLSAVELNIGTLDISAIDMPISSIDLDVTNLKCRGLQLGELTITSAITAETEIELTVHATNIAISCSCDWRYHYMWGGDGTAAATATAAMENAVTVVVRLHSRDFRTALPQPPSVGSSQCTLQHAGGADGFTVDLEELMGNNVGGHIGAVAVDHAVHEKTQDAIRHSLTSNGALCDQLRATVPQMLTGVLGQLNEQLRPVVQYVDMPPVTREGMLAMERSFLRPGATALLSLRGNQIVVLLEQAAAKLGAPSTRAAELCLDDYRGVSRCRGNLQVNDAIDFGLTDGSVEFEEFPGLFGVNSTITAPSDTIDIALTVRKLRMSG